MWGPCKRAIKIIKRKKIFLNVSDYKSGDRNPPLAPFVSSALYVPYPFHGF